MKDEDMQRPWLTEALGAHSRYSIEGGRLIAAGQSPFQAWDVWDSPQFGRLFRLDGCLMSSEKDEFFYHENLVHVAAMAHPAPRHALVIGGGDGGSAEELLKYPQMEGVTLVELDAAVLALARAHLGAIHRGVFDDPRLTVLIGDGLRHVEAQGTSGAGHYDLIVLDLTDPVGPARALYEVPFLAACRRLLRPDGALTLHLGAPNHRPDSVRRVLEALRVVFAEVSPYFLYIPLYGALWGMACASDRLRPAALSAGEIDARIARAGLQALQYYNGSVHVAQFALPNYLRTLLAVKGD